MKLLILPQEKFSCQSCTDCCRHWHVQLLPGERDRIERQPWGDDKPPGDWFLSHGGQTYLAHRDNGACAFLNESNGLCIIHERFGGPIKPLGCQLYPFQIAPTFAREASVTARYDCPAVRRNEGAPHADSLPALRQFADALELGQPFDDATRCHLDRDQIAGVADFVGTLMDAFPRNDQRAIFIAYVADWVSTLNTDELDRATLGRGFAPLKQMIEAVTAGPLKRPGLMQRMAFRTLLAMYLRRDEDVLDGRAGRIGRMAVVVKVVIGFGGFRGLGITHPPGTLRRAKLFRLSNLSNDPAVFGLLWRLIRNKLESLQFMGQANGGKDFLEGLRSLALLYPLVASTAKYTAANRGAAAVEVQDVDHAVAAVAHSFGRQAVLKQRFVKSLERVLMDHESFTHLARSI